MIDFIEKLLIDLIGIDTQRTTANEYPAARYLQKELFKIGIPSRVYEPKPGRGSLIAKIPGSEADSVILHAHLDTAEIDFYDWTYPPLSATVTKNRIFGRGALDCKGLCAIWAGILKYFWEYMPVPRKTLVLAATCDEESGGALGTQWLMENTGVFENAALVLGEGGGFALQADGQLYYTIQTGERMKIPLNILQNCDMSDLREQSKKSAPQIKSPLDPFCIVERGIQADYFNDATRQYMRAEHYGKRRIPPDNFNGTIVERHGEHSFAYILPFLTQDEAGLTGGQAIHRADTGKPVRLTKKIARIQHVLRRLGCSEILLPVVTPGYSDNRFFRDKGIPTLGFFPIGLDNAISGIHGADEYISRQSLKRAFTILLESVIAFSN